jgi:hypothetical protein
MQSDRELTMQSDRERGFSSAEFLNSNLAVGIRQIVVFFFLSKKTLKLPNERT